MKNLFDADTYQEIARRLDTLKPDSPRQWGKMQPSQALEHLARVLDSVLGPQPARQMFLGKMIGWMVEGRFLGPELAAFHALGRDGADGRIHLFFGPLTGQKWGETQYKHFDHHLGQFGV